MDKKNLISVISKRFLYRSSIVKIEIWGLGWKMNNLMINDCLKWVVIALTVSVIHDNFEHAAFGGIGITKFNYIRVL